MICRSSILKVLFLLNFLFLNFNAGALAGDEKYHSLKDYLSGIKESTNNDLYVFKNIYNLDVLNYFTLNEYDVVGNKKTLSEKYNTPLKKKFFMSSQEYKDKLDELKDIKKKMLNNYYFTTRDVVWNYDLTKKGMEFREYAFDVLYSQFNIEWLDIKTPVNVYFFPMSEEQGLCVENTKDAWYYVVYKIKGVKKLIEEDVIVADVKKVIIADSKTGNVCYIKTFTR